MCGGYVTVGGNNKKYLSKIKNMGQKYTDNWSILKNPNRSGGQGMILIVQNKNQPIKGALKQMHERQQNIKIKRERMCREIASLKKISRKGIPKIYEDNSSEVDLLGTPLYFICEWIDGKTLHDLYFNNPATIEVAIQITRDLCLIIDSCHQENILHRDIKPQNIIISNIGETYLVDFGLAWIKSTEEDASIFNTPSHEEISNFFLRLPEYMTGYEKHDEVSDVTYLVGILFFLLTGQNPKSLADGFGKPPHETLLSEIPDYLLEDPRWYKIKRIFSIGFNPSIKHRFVSAIDLIQKLDEVNKDEQDTTLSIETNFYTQKVDELLNSTTHKAKEILLNSLTEVNNYLEKKLTQEAKKINLTTSVNNAIGGNFRQVNIYFSNTDYSNVRIHFSHEFKFSDDFGTKVKGIFSFNDSLYDLSYDGYSTDKDGMHIAMDLKVDEIISKIAQIYWDARNPPPLFL